MQTEPGLEVWAPLLGLHPSQTGKPMREAVSTRRVVLQSRCRSEFVCRPTARAPNVSREGCGSLHGSRRGSCRESQSRRITTDPRHLRADGTEHCGPNNTKAFGKSHGERSVSPNQKYRLIDDALIAIAESAPSSQLEIYQSLDERHVVLPWGGPLKSAGGWMGFVTTKQQLEHGFRGGGLSCICRPCPAAQSPAVAELPAIPAHK